MYVHLLCFLFVKGFCLNSFFMSPMQVAALIQHLIENTPAIFGEDVECIFTEPKKEQGTAEDVMGEIYIR